MLFKEPKAKFVEIDMSIVTVTSTCDEVTTQGAGAETCAGPTAPQNNCNTMVQGGWLRN